MRISDFEELEEMSNSQFEIPIQISLVSTAQRVAAVREVTFSLL